MEDGETIEADVCIVGSGAAGISMATEFLNSKYDVFLLEGGSIEYDETHRKNYECKVVGLKHNVNETRGRVFGGTTTMWPGQASPFDPIDFEKREWVNLSGWPIKYDELKPYFIRSEEKMNLPHSSYNEETWPKNSLMPPTFDPTKLTNIFSQFSPTADFARQYRSQIKNSMNVHAIFNAAVVEIRVK